MIDEERFGSDGKRSALSSTSGGGDGLRRGRCGLLVGAVSRLYRRSPGSPVRRSIAARMISTQNRCRRGAFAALGAGVARFAKTIRGSSLHSSAWGAPVRSTHRMPLTVRRLSSIGGPRSPRSGSSGSRIRHCPSVRSPRLNAASLTKAALNSKLDSSVKNRQHGLAHTPLKEDDPNLL